jgi:hypothetical protein
MAEIHNRIPRGLISAAVTAAVGIVSGDAGIERLDESLEAIIDLWSQPEFYFLRNEALCGGQNTQTAGGATTLASVALINPAASKKLIVVRAIWGYLSVAAEVRINLDTESSIVGALLTGNVGGMFLDTRWSSRSSGGAPVGYIRTGLPTGLVGVRLYQSQWLANTTIEPLAPRDMIVLSPGFGCVLQNTDDAATMIAGFTWRERNAFKGELV